MMLACTVFGHRPAFQVDGHTMRWVCDRCGQGAGAKEYNTPDDARRYAAAFNRRASDDLGKRAPLIGLLPLRLWRRIKIAKHAPGRAETGNDQLPDYRT